MNTRAKVESSLQPICPINILLIICFFFTPKQQWLIISIEPSDNHIYHFCGCPMIVIFSISNILSPVFFYWGRHESNLIVLFMLFEIVSVNYSPRHQSISCIHITSVPPLRQSSSSVSSIFQSWLSINISTQVKIGLIKLSINVCVREK